MLREIFGQEPGVKDWWNLGKVGSVGKVSFHTSDHVWTFLRRYKGRKFCHGTKQLWRTLDHPQEEVFPPPKRVSLAIKALRTPGHVRKPIGWECNDHIAFNNTVRTQLKGSSSFSGQESRLNENPSFALYIYTDGSARDVSRRQKCAGGGFYGYDDLETSRWWRPVAQRRCRGSSKHFSG